MNVGANGAGVDDGIGASNGELLVGKVQNSKGALVLGSRGGTEQGGEGGSGSELHGCWWFLVGEG